MRKLNDTIVAISTPVGQGGIGIVRLSGKQSLPIADKIFKPANRNGKRALKPSGFKTHTVRYGWIVDNSKKRAGKASIIDEVLLTVMRSPKTYTREDIVEINCHSGIVPLKRILDLVLNRGARLAEPGEFTRRAFLNGRIDLVQAEAVLDIIRTKSEHYHKACLDRLGGSFSRHIEVISEDLFEIIANFEAQIDFPEDTVRQPIEKLLAGIEDIRARLMTCLKSTQESKSMRDGISVAIAGRPNVGKSSLLNALINEDRCLVTPFAGTTRDAIEESICFDAIPLRFIDTAGLRKALNPVEKQAALRSEKLIDSAQLVLLVFDASASAKRDDAVFIEKFKDKKNVLAVLNKIDLPIKFNDAVIKKRFAKPVRISALRRLNLEALKKRIVKRVWQGKLTSDDCVFLLNARQEKLLDESTQLLKNACFSLKGGLSVEIVAEDLKKAFASLSRLCGKSCD
jgi:tRNA modification GTPase